MSKPNIVVRLKTAAFELRPSPTDGQYYVVDATSYNRNAHNLVGQPFEVGRNPWEWSEGFATLIQQELNRQATA